MKVTIEKYQVYGDGTSIIEIDIPDDAIIVSSRVCDYYSVLKRFKVDGPHNYKREEYTKGYYMLFDINNDNVDTYKKQINQKLKGSSIIINGNKLLCYFELCEIISECAKSTFDELNHNIDFSIEYIEEKKDMSQFYLIDAYNNEKEKVLKDPNYVIDIKKNLKERGLEISKLIYPVAYYHLLYIGEKGIYTKGVGIYPMFGVNPANLEKENSIMHTFITVRNLESKFNKYRNDTDVIRHGKEFKKTFDDRIKEIVDL